MKQVQNYATEIVLGDSSLDLLAVIVRVTVAVAVIVEVVVVVVPLLQLQSGRENVKSKHAVGVNTSAQVCGLALISKLKSVGIPSTGGRGLFGMGMASPHAKMYV